MDLKRLSVRFGAAAPQQLAETQIDITEAGSLREAAQFFSDAIDGNVSGLRHDWEPFYVLELGLSNDQTLTVNVRNDFTYYSTDRDWRLDPRFREFARTKLAIHSPPSLMLPRRALLRLGLGAPRSAKSNQVEVSDGPILRQMAGFFWEALEGHSSSLGGGWMPYYLIELIRENLPPLPVLISPDFRFYSSMGDWQLDPEFREFARHSLSI